MGGGGDVDLCYLIHLPEREAQGKSTAMATDNSVSNIEDAPAPTAHALEIGHLSVTEQYHQFAKI